MTATPPRTCRPRVNRPCRASRWLRPRKASKPCPQRVRRSCGVTRREPPMQWKAPKNKVIVQIAPRKQTTEGGIVLPDKATEGPIIRGTVLAAGDDTGIDPGDTVIFMRKG